MQTESLPACDVFCFASIRLIIRSVIEFVADRGGSTTFVATEAAGTLLLPSLILFRHVAGKECKVGRTEGP